MMSITLIRGAQVFAPQPLGVQDVLIAGSRIAAIGPSIDLHGEPVQIVDATNFLLLPGLVDSLVHFAGGGGEGGFHTRTPEMHLSEATLGGVTTLIGALGTDATTRSLPDLLAKARGLDNEGLSTYCYAGSYHLPACTFSGSITDDLVLIDKCIGIGEIAIADHRGAQLSAAELARAASQARVGGMLAGKSGMVSIHVGDGDSRLQLLHEVVDNSELPPSQFYPTHINRNQTLLDAGIVWCRRGGLIDMTTSTNEAFIAEGEIPAAAAIAQCLAKGVDVRQLSMSSDGNASLPVFDQHGELIGLEVGRTASLYDAFTELVQQHDVAIETAIQVVSTSPARHLKLASKGQITVDADADVLLVNPDTLAIDSVFARGKCLVRNGQALRRGTFETL
ncbi:beta-aspartyl-peptidase [Aestuariibacter halophilus]|uniref:Isoaspartyl dipeptidase n=1 Tax=Fluctibacter halophilus TaxID=226011 RepID=A0ABS8GA48_9ALTE|nr:beta-aspartyl-peptidase [Aestuariibacter halophilus]MCC2616584.1 beta-aspartyl-peptidase [Aestuariibacter halophilus]